MDYTTLVASSATAGSIANWISHPSAQAAAPSILAEAESYIYRRLRHWRMLTRISSLVFVIGQDYIALSGIARFLEDKTFYITGVNFAQLTKKTEQEVIGGYSYDGAGVRINSKPTIYYMDKTNLWFENTSDQAYTTLLTYYEQPAALGVANTTNFLTDYYPRLLRCACMVGASEFMKDAGMGNYDRTYWEGETDKEVAIAMMESDRAQHNIQIGAVIT